MKNHRTFSTNDNTIKHPSLWEICRRPFDDRRKDLVRHFIFDLDGTLLDTLCDLATSVNYAMEQCHYPTHSIDKVRMMVGNGVATLIKRAVPSGTSEEDTAHALDIFKKHYMEHGEDTTRPYDGIIELLSALKQQGKQIAVVSNKFDAATKALCDKYFPNLIDIALGENEAEGIRKKPAPDMVLKAMKQLHATPDECVYIGDSDVDFHTAQNAGIPCISVLWGFRTKEFLQSHGATVFVEKPEEIAQLNEK